MRNRLKKIISSFLVLTLVITNCQITAFADDTSLSLTQDDISNRQMFSQTYSYNGVEKTAYVYNDSTENKAYLTGDIIYPKGSSENFECIHQDGYDTLPFRVKSFSVVNTKEYTGRTGYAFLFLAEDNNLYNYCDIDTIHGDYWYTIEDSIKKLQGAFYLTSDDELKIIKMEPLNNTDTVIAKDVSNFSLSYNSLLRIEYNNGNIEYKNYASGWDYKNQSYETNTRGGYVEYTYNSDSDVTVDYSSGAGGIYGKHRYTVKDKVTGVSQGLDELTPSSSDAEYDYYFLFNDKVKLCVKSNSSNNVLKIRAISNDNSKVTVSNGWIFTDYGDITISSTVSQWYNVPINVSKEISEKSDLLCDYIIRTIDGSPIMKFDISSNSKPESSEFNLSNDAYVNSNTFAYNSTTENTHYNVDFSFSDNINDCKLTIRNLDNDKAKTYNLSDYYTVDNTNNIVNAFNNDYCVYLNSSNNSYIFNFYKLWHNVIRQDFTEQPRFYISRYDITNQRIYLSGPSLNRDSANSNDFHTNWHINLMEKDSNGRWNYRFDRGENFDGFINSFLFENNYGLEKAYGKNYIASEVLGVEHNSFEDTFNNEAIRLGDRTLRCASTVSHIPSPENSSLENEIEKTRGVLDTLDFADNIIANKNYLSQDLQYEVGDKTSNYVDRFKTIYTTATTYEEFKTGILSLYTDASTLVGFYCSRYSKSSGKSDFDFIKKLLSDKNSYAYLDGCYSQYEAFVPSKYGQSDSYIDVELDATSPINSVVAPISEKLKSSEYKHKTSIDTMYSLTSDNKLLKTDYNLDESRYSDGFYDKAVVTNNSIDTNVVAVESHGYYLKSNGELYNSSKERINTGVSCLIDNLYQKAGNWYYLSDNTQFKQGYGNEHNVSFDLVSESNSTISYEVNFDNSIDYIIAPDDSILHSGDTITLNEDGCYIYHVVNTYGDTSDKYLFVKFNESADTTERTIKTDIVGNNVKISSTLAGEHKFYYSTDESNWVEIGTDGFEYTEPVYIKEQVSGVDTSNLYMLSINNGNAVLNSVVNTKFSLSNFAGLGYVDTDGNLLTTDSSNKDSSVLQGLIYDDKVSSSTRYYSKNSPYGHFGFYDFNSYGVETGDNYAKTITKIFSSDKLKVDNEYENPVRVFFTNLYTYIVGNTGKVTKGRETLRGIDIGYSGVYVDSWDERWLEDKTVASVDDAFGKITFTDGTTLDTCYSERLNKKYDELPFYTDSSYYIYSQTDDLSKLEKDTEPKTIVAARVIADGYAVLTSDGSIYVTDPKAMGYYLKGIATGDSGYDIDYSIDNVNYTNSGVSLYLYPSSGTNFSSFGEHEITGTFSTKYNTGMVTDSDGNDWSNCYIYDYNTRNLSPSTGDCILTTITPDNDMTISYVVYCPSNLLKSSSSGSKYTVNYSTSNFGINFRDTNWDLVYPTSVVNMLTGTEVTNNNLRYYVSSANKDNVYQRVNYTLKAGKTYSMIIPSDFRTSLKLAYKSGNSMIVNGEQESLLYFEDVDFPFTVSDGSKNYTVSQVGATSYGVTIPRNVRDLVINEVSESGDIYKTAKLSISNIDTVKPYIRGASINVDTNVIECIAEDMAGTGIDINSAISGIDKVYYSTDNVNFSELTGDVHYKSGNGVVINDPLIYLYAIDRAGNKSDVKSVNLDLVLNHSVEYENNNTTVEFYGDNDDSWSNADYSYSYNIEDGNTILDHTFTVNEDCNATIKVTKVKSDSVISRYKNLDLEVVSIPKPDISDVDNTSKKVSVGVSDIKHATFDKLYVKVDSGSYKEYTTESIETDSLDLGTHTISAYATAIRDGKTITGEVNTKVISILDDMELHPFIDYANGKTTLTYYADNDENHDKGYSYFYKTDSTFKDGYKVSITEDTDVDIKATKSGKKDGVGVVSLKVIKTDAPTISDLIDNSNIIVSAGSYSNAILKNLSIKIDDGEYIDYTSAQKVISDLSEGSHTITAKQSVLFTDSGDEIVITSNESTKEVYIKGEMELYPEYTYENNKTTVKFYADDDVDFNKGYSYKYGVDNKDGHEFTVTSDSTVTIKGEHPNKLSASKDIDVKVVGTEVPIISDLHDTNRVNINAGAYRNSILEGVYVSIDNSNFVKILSTSDVFSLLKGSHTIKAYQIVEFDNNGVSQQIKSDTVSKDVYIPYPIELHSSKSYKNGETTLSFYANDDEKNEDYNYSIDSESIHSIKVNTNKDVTIKADKDGYVPASKQVHIDVISTDKPIITEKDGKVEINKGKISDNASFVKFDISVDGTDIISNNDNYIINNLSSGEHTIKATQTVGATFDNDYITIDSDESVYTLTIKDNITIKDSYKYSNGSTEVSFYGNDDKDNKQFSYSYSIKGSSNKGNNFKVSKDTDGVLLKATGNKYNDGNKVVDIKVSKTNAPIISDDLVVKAGSIKNGTLNSLYVQIDDNGFTPQNDNFKLVNLSKGKHIIKAYQTILAADNKTVIKSDIATKEITIKDDIEHKYYKLRVIDKYDGVSNVRWESSLLESTDFLVDALYKDGYLADKSSQEGKMTEDIDIIFNYTKESLDNPDNIYCNIKVVDHFEDSSSIRVDRSVRRGSTYSYKAISKDGWLLTSQYKYEGKVDNDIQLDFYYKKDKSIKADINTLTVIDNFDGNKSVRYVQTAPTGYIYDVQALDIDGWQVEGTASYKDTLTSDKELVFNYTKKKVSITINDHFNDDIKERSREEVTWGTGYTVSALGLDDWNVRGTSEYVDIAYTDTVIDFYYDKGDVTIDTNKVYHTLKVIDNFDGDNKLRLERKLIDGEVYNYSPLIKDNWKSNDKKVSGISDKDITIIFNYYKDTSDKPNEKVYTLKVLDHFGDTVETRLVESVTRGYYYNIGALDRDTWRAIKTTNYSGTITKNTTLNFYYESTLPKEYTLTIVDHFGNKSDIRSKEKLLENTEYTVSALGLNDWDIKGDDIKVGKLIKDTTVDFYYKKATPKYSDNKDYYTLQVKDRFDKEVNTRINRKVKSGYKYEFNSLNKTGWKVKGKSSHKGVVKKNTILDFNYIKDSSNTGKKFKLTVIDHFGNTVETRYSVLVDKDFYYNIGSVDRDGWLAKNTSSVSGKMDKDITLDFYYSRIEKPKNYYTLTIIDEYNSHKLVRSKESLLEGTKYTVSSINIQGYHVVGKSEYSAKMTKDKTITFTYKKNSTPRGNNETYHNIKVVDHFGNNAETRISRHVVHNFDLSVKALNKKCWKVKGSDSFSNKITKDTIVDFYYTQDNNSTGDSYKLTVVDIFDKDKEVRFSTLVPKGYYYNIGAVDRDEWIADDIESKSGVVTKDIVLEFNYTKMPADAKFYNLKVYDHYDDNTELRLETNLLEGTEYTISCLEKDDYKVKGQDFVNGVAKKDIVIDFYYDTHAKTDKQYYTLKVVDHFGNTQSLRLERELLNGAEYYYKALNKDGWKPKEEYISGVVNNSNVILDFYYDEDNNYHGKDYTLKVYDHYDDSSVLRYEQNIEKDFFYSIGAITKEGWELVGDSNFSGKAKGDIIIDFYYKKLNTDIPKSDIPEPTDKIVPYKHDEPSVPAKTGDMTDLSKYFIMLLLSGAVLFASIRRKKFSK